MAWGGIFIGCVLGALTLIIFAYLVARLCAAIIENRRRPFADVGNSAASKSREGKQRPTAEGTHKISHTAHDGTDL